MICEDLPSPVPWLARLAPAVHGSFDVAEAQRLGVSPDHVLDFSANGNVVGPPPGVREALARLDLSRYPDREATSFRRAIAARHGVTPANVAVGNGSSELIWALARVYLRPQQRALVLAPTFGEYEVATRAAGGEAVVLNALEPGCAVDVNHIVGEAAQAEARLVWLCHPNNPTGAGLPAGLVEGLLQGVPGAMVVVDEAYLPLCDLSAIRVGGHGRVVVLRSLTKDAALAGLRMGYLIAHEGVAEVVRRSLPPWNVSSVAQAAGEVALADSGHTERARAAVAASRRHLVAGLDKLGLGPYPSVANFVLVPVGDGAQVHGALLSRGCAVRDCTSFGLPDCIRIGVRPIADQERLLAALAEVVGG